MSLFYKRRDRRYVSFRMYMATVIVLVAAFVGLVLIVVGNESKRSNEDEYEVTSQRISEITRFLDDEIQMVSDIHELQYERSVDLYKAVKKACEKTNDQITIETFNSIFPDDDTFIRDKASGLIRIYAFLENHPEIKIDDNVLNALLTMEIGRVELENKIELYNMNVEFYEFWKDRWNDNRYIVKHYGKLTEKYTTVVLR